MPGKTASTISIEKTGWTFNFIQTSKPESTTFALIATSTATKTSLWVSKSTESTREISSLFDYKSIAEPESKTINRETASITTQTSPWETKSSTLTKEPTSTFDIRTCTKGYPKIYTLYTEIVSQLTFKQCTLIEFAATDTSNDKLNSSRFFF